MLAPFAKARIRPVLTIFMITLALDQGTKEIARQMLRDHGANNYLSGLVTFAYAENTGAFLSLGAQLGETARLLVFIIGVFLILLWAAYLLLRKPQLDRLEVVGLALLFSGGFGNLIDRLFRGSVTDFMQMGWAPLRTGIFNVADMAILAGVGLMMLHSSLSKKKAGQPASSSKKNF